MKLEKFINSLRAVTIPMLLIILAFTIKIAALLYSVFEIPNQSFKISASVLLAIALSLTLMTVSVNSYLFKKQYFPVTFAVCSGVMMLFVFKVIEEDSHHWTWYSKRIFLSIFLAFVEYTYSKLFVKKYQEQRDTIKLEEDHKSLLVDYSGLQSQIKSFKESMSSQQESIDNLSQYQKALRCKKCKKQHTSVSSFKGCKHVDPLEINHL